MHLGAVVKKDEVGAYGAFDLVLFEGDHVDLGVSHGRLALLMLGFHLLVKKLVGDLFEALEAQIGAADHQQRCDQPRRKRTDEQRGWHEDGLVQQRALGHCPDHRQFTVGLDAGDLLRIERQVVAQYAGGFLRGQGHVVQQCGDVVQKGKQAACGHGYILVLGLGS